MKIALVSPYDFAYPGGVPNHIAALERQFTRLGHDVRVIAPASKVVPDFGNRFIPLGKPRPIPTSGSIARITISLRLAARIKAVLERENFDIVHLHEPFMPMLCSAVLRFSNTAIVGTFHACGGKPGYRFGWPISAIIIHRRAPKIEGKIAVSLAAQRFARKTIRGDYDIVPNGIDLNQFSPERVEPLPQYCDGKLNILFVGRLERRKGLLYLLRAFWRLKQEIPNTRLIVVGPGKLLRGTYERWARRHRLQDVEFVGYVSQAELPRYYRSADVFCAPATGRESFGIVLLEAMAMGKAIVASDIEGYRCVLTHGVEGILVPPKDDKKLAYALKSVLIDGAMRQRIGANGRIKAREYAWEKVAHRVLDCYAKVLSKPRWRKAHMLMAELAARGERS